ncbi:DUF6873 family GME fold protein [Lutibacter citreus]|uniref:DUF6873 family GME fold protein n=1 Tax=Lutibacter citreus TaxID=2138210 RepID=UPI000DBE530D|nr:hypothetical protein [Lutibacter citreus]
MYAIIDKRTPLDVKNNLAKYTNDIFEFSSKGITYNSISGHPDIFIFQDEKGLVLAPNTPKSLIEFLNNKAINYSFGIKNVGENLDDSVLYNCLTSEKHFFCKKNKPDVSIQQRSSQKTLINLPQAFARCSMFVIKDKVVTSDKGILNVLKKNVIDYFYFDPSEIKIKDHKNGFIGGTMGSINNKVFFLGNILKHHDGEALYKFISNQGKDVICLGNDYLYDGGSIFFVS